MFYSLQAPYVNPYTLEPSAGGQNRAQGKVLPFGMKIDNGEVQIIYLDSTVTWNYRAHYNTDASLTAGEHTITFTQINGNEGSKGNLQLAAAVDKLDLTYVPDIAARNDFDIDLTEMTAFKENDGYRVTAVAPEAGYYNVTADGGFKLKKQSVNYASDAKTYSQCSVYDNEVSNTVYLSKGANTIFASGDAKKLSFKYDKEKTEASKTVINAGDMTIHGTTPYYKENKYAASGSVVAELGVGQNAAEGDRAEDSYIDFKLNAPEAGVYNLAIRYANDEPAPVMKKTDGSTYIHPYNIDLVERYAQIKVNDNEPETVYFRNTMSWESFKTVDVQVQLNAGENTVRIYNDNSYQFSTLVNSTAPEIDTVTVTKQSYGANKVTASKTTAEPDTSKLDAAIAKANAINEADYSAKTVQALKDAVAAVSRENQSEINKSTEAVLNAIKALKPPMLDLADYYVTSYESGAEGTPEKSFDGDESTAWTADRSGSPYVAYEVFDAGKGNVYNLNQIKVRGDSNTRVMYLGTNSDDILKTPAEMGASSDLAKKDANLYRPFAELYSADILGTAQGAEAETELSGKYRYLIVAATVWSKTTIGELELNAVVEDVDGCGGAAVLKRETGKVSAEFNVKYNNTGSKVNAYLAEYDKDGALVQIKSTQLDSGTQSIDAEIKDSTHSYKAFLWDKDMKPLN